ncbi:hypothetical protein AMECASPLE_038970 [Ameca splendens]|uniref:Uncharacterized protein n=1 Tax=Ameca splendens TaxID=208324 RepID=A0ABV0ZI49_9TELE
MFRGVWKLQPRRPSPEPPFCFQLQAQLLKSRLILTINLPVHLPTLSLQPLWSFLEEKKTQAKEHSNSHKTVHILSASSHCGKVLITPWPYQDLSPTDPDFARCSSPTPQKCVVNKLLL